MKPTLEQKEYALHELTSCLVNATEGCDDCELDLAGESECGCSVNGGDLVDAVCQAIADLKAEIAAAQKK